jgi:hypothetical protein
MREAISKILLPLAIALFVSVWMVILVTPLIVTPPSTPTLYECPCECEEIVKDKPKPETK